MKFLLTILFCFSIFSSSLMSQTFNRSFFPEQVGASGGDISPSSMISDASGGTVSIYNLEQGPSSGFPDLTNAHVIKVDFKGSFVWSIELGNSQDDDRLNSLCQTDDGGYILVGSSFSSDISVPERSWVVRLDASGALVSDLFTTFNEEPSRYHLVKRTSEVQETYFVAGSASDTQFNPVGRNYLTAAKIDGSSGSTIWSNIYQPFLFGNSLDTNFSDEPTSMIEDIEGEGMIVAGVRGRGMENSDSDLITIGIRLDGSLFRPYRAYNVFNDGLELFNEETHPSIIRNINNDGYVMAFGVEGQNFNAFVQDVIAVMPLDFDLVPEEGVIIYDPGLSKTAYGHSIYDNGNGQYDIGCTANLGGVTAASSAVPFNGVSFLTIDGFGFNPLNYVEYEILDNGVSTSMVQSPTGYVTNFIHNSNGFTGMGFIGIEPNGDGGCPELSNVTMNIATVEHDTVFHIVNGIDPNEFQFPLDANINNTFDTLQCFVLGTFNSTSHVKIDPQLIPNELNVYPTLIEMGSSEFTLEFTLQRDSPVSFSIVNALGQLVSTFDVEGVEGSNLLSVPSVNLSNGVNSIIMDADNSGTPLVSRVIKL